MLPAAQDLAVGDLAHVCCQACGLYDASLRHSAHPSVVSVLFSAAESAHVGIWCGRCRGVAAAKATAVSLLAGWWSLRGPKLTIAAIRANLAGGQQSAGANAQLLRALARREYENGNPEMAASFAGAAHAAQPQRDNSRLLDELKRAGHPPLLANSPWRFAPFAPVVVVAIAALGLGLHMVSGADHNQNSSAQPVDGTRHQSAQALVNEKWRAQQSREAAQWAQAHASADDIEKQLTAESEPSMGGYYLRTRLGELRADIPLRVRRGDDLWSADASIRAMRDKAAVSRYMELHPTVRTAYENLLDTMSEATRYYHGGAPVDAIQRTAGESINVTVDIALDAIDADLRGHTDQSNALGSEFDQRADSLLQMKRDLRIRGAVIALTTRAIDTCLKAANQ